MAPELLDVEVLSVLRRAVFRHKLDRKTGQTVQDDFFVGLRKWLNYAREQALEPTLIYEGGDNYTRSGIAVKSWKAL